eukprot:CAMPEP_0119546686 /NCGR_PEP_ID=MMETSP1352-20130426/997_1 /TAXON_ID=265584 /ORGANISM="Stauroneis constricta, Strain CCMP1120" /LENGTH=387 /DNA_ID=CAMNT_0007591411 /DNA_START=137 /DNA_END=1300 /DNA_ORIENTATION=+
MTMQEPRYSPAKRKQFLLICTVMASVFLYSCMTSGLFLPVEPTIGSFEGGEYIYKMAQRDYAASNGLGKHIRKNILELKSEYAVDDTLFHVYFDNPAIMGGRRQRWLSGMMSHLAPAEQVEVLKQKMAEFQASGKTKLNPEDTFDISTIDLWDQLPLERAELPTVKALVLPFPFTNGFVSALIASYKIIPAMRKLALKEGEEGLIPVVISNCHVKEKMCIHYAPLEKGTDFMLGYPDTAAHNEALGKETFLDAKGMKQGMKKVLPFLYDIIFPEPKVKEDEATDATATTTTTTTTTTKPDASTAEDTDTTTTATDTTTAEDTGTAEDTTTTKPDATAAEDTHTATTATDTTTATDRSTAEDTGTVEDTTTTAKDTSTAEEATTGEEL